MEPQTRLEQRLQMTVQDVMVGVQQVDAGGDPGLNPAHDREVVAALDPMVAVQMLEIGLKRRDQTAMQQDQITSRTPVRDLARHLGLLVAKAAVHLQPEAGDLAKIRIPPA